VSDECDVDAARWSLDALIDRVAPWLDPAIVPARGAARVRAVLSAAPAALSRCVYLETRLAEEAPQVDVIVGVASEDRDVLATAWASCGYERQRSTWPHVRAFTEAWATTSCLDRQVTRLWLEFDLPAEADPASAAAVPRIFVDFRQGWLGGRARAIRVMAEVLRAARLRCDVAPLMDGFRACIERLPAGAVIPCVGLAPADEPVLRLCIAGVGDQLPAYLRSVQWPGRAEDVARAILRPLAGTDAETPRAPTLVHVDLAPSLLPQLGMEYRFHGASQHGENILETCLLNRLVELGWCTEAACRGLLHWPGDSLELFEHEVWHSRLGRRLNHVKVVYSPDAPVAVKAYLRVSNDLDRRGTVVAGRPRVFGSRPDTGNGATAPSSRGAAPSTPSSTPQVVE
jgi:hypothetical protein